MKYEIMNCENGEFRVGKHTIRDVHPVGVVPFPEVLIRSSNVCMAKIGLRMGKEELHQSLRQYGFGAQTGVELKRGGSRDSQVVERF